MSQSARRYARGTNHKFPVNPRREHHHPATPLHKRLPKFLPTPTQMPEELCCMYCGTPYVSGQFTRNSSCHKGFRFRRNGLYTPRHGVSCRNTTQCRRNRRKGGVGVFFQRTDS